MIAKSNSYSVHLNCYSNIVSRNYAQGLTIVREYDDDSNWLVFVANLIMSQLCLDDASGVGLPIIAPIIPST